MDTNQHEFILKTSILFVSISVHSWFKYCYRELRQAEPDLQALLQKVSHLRRLHLSQFVEAQSDRWFTILAFDRFVFGDDAGNAAGPD